MYTSTTYLPSLVQIRSAVKKCKKCQILRQTQNPDPDPDPKTEHTPNAPSLGEHCAQVWLKSIQPSRRSSVLSVSHIYCRQIRILIRIQKLSTPQMPPHQGSIVPKFGSNPSNRLGGVAFGVYHILSHFFGSQIRIQIRIQKLSTTQMPPHQGNIVSKFGSNPSNRLGGVAFFLNCGRRRQTDDDDRQTDAAV